MMNSLLKVNIGFCQEYVYLGYMDKFECDGMLSTLTCEVRSNGMISKAKRISP